MVLKKLLLILPISVFAWSDTGFKDTIQFTETDGSPKCMAGQVKVGAGQLTCSGQTATLTITGGGGGGATNGTILTSTPTNVAVYSDTTTVTGYQTLTVDSSSAAVNALYIDTDIHAQPSQGLDVTTPNAAYGRLNLYGTLGDVGFAPAQTLISANGIDFRIDDVTPPDWRICYGAGCGSSTVAEFASVPTGIFSYMMMAGRKMQFGVGAANNYITMTSSLNVTGGGGIASTYGVSAGSVSVSSSTYFSGVRYSWPSSGTVGNYLQYLSSNTLQWVAVSASGGAGTPGGNSGQLQYNSAGAFAGATSTVSAGGYVAFGGSITTGGVSSGMSTIDLGLTVNNGSTGNATSDLIANGDTVANLLQVHAASDEILVKGPLATNSTIISSATATIGWSMVSVANQACNTTCTYACVIGFDTGTLGVTLPNLVACTDATADDCICAGPN